MVQKQQEGYSLHVGGVSLERVNKEYSASGRETLDRALSIYVRSNLFSIKPKTISVWGYLPSPGAEGAYSSLTRYLTLTNLISKRSKNDISFFSRSHCQCARQPTPYRSSPLMNFSLPVFGPLWVFNMYLHLNSLRLKSLAPKKTCYLESFQIINRSPYVIYVLLQR